MSVNIVGFRDPIPADAIIINTTSRSKNWSQGLSPFYLGPVPLYAGHQAQNVENAWQFSKVYAQHVDEEGNPSQAYWAWAQRGWADTYAHRYPMGRGAKPLYSWWDGEKLDYLQARQKIYLPLYAQAVQASPAFEKLVQWRDKAEVEGKDLYLQDFDGYNHRALGWTYQQVLDCPTKKMGHAFVLGMLLEGEIR
jgi:hypothetical protein